MRISDLNYILGGFLISIGFVDVKNGMTNNSTSRCCFRTVDRVDNRCDAIAIVVILGHLVCCVLIWLVIKSLEMR